MTLPVYEITDRRQRQVAHDVHGSGAWRATLQQFLRYCLVGGVNTLIDVLALNILLWGLPTKNVLVLVAYNSCAYGAGAATSFFLNKYWTFGHRHTATRQELLRFAIILALEILYSNGLVWLAGRALQPLIANPILWANASKLLAVGAARFSHTPACASGPSPALQRGLHEHFPIFLQHASHAVRVR
jgi:putative flippase GtrA